MLYIKSSWFRHLVIIGLGAMVLSMFCLLPGCGSDSTPKGAASAKKEKAGKSVQDKDMKSITSLLSPNEGASQLQHVDNIPGMPSPEEIEAKKKAGAEWWDKQDAKYEMLPGLTKEQLEAKLEAARAKKPDPNVQLLPGLTQRQVDANLMAARQRPPLSGELVPGLSEEQAKAKLDQARRQAEDFRSPEKALRPK
jgi:hypothetical protein